MAWGEGMNFPGEGGGVWTVRVVDGTCDVAAGFSERADVRYTADARIWCGVALGILDARDVYKRGLMTKEGSREAMDFYFHQLSGTPLEDRPRGDPELADTPFAEKRKRSKT